MSKKAIDLKQAQQHAKSFLIRWFSTVFVLLAILFISSISNFYKYGFNKTGSRHHSYLDYPNEISSVDALELSEFIESLNTTYNADRKIYHPFELEESNGKYWETEIDVKDRFKRSQIIQAIAKDVGLSEDKFPLAHQHHVITDKIKNRLKSNIAFPPDYLKMKKPPRPHVPQCDTSKLHHHKTTLIHFSTQQYKTTKVKVDGLFSDGGKINVRVATPEEESQLKQNIRVNLTLYAQTTESFDHVKISQIDSGVTATKNIHINSNHLSKTCLIYNLDIVFPAKLLKYKDLDIRANHANSIGGNLEALVFEKFVVGLGRGAINFKGVTADEIWLGTLNGIVLGHYLPNKKFGAASVKGATNVQISPQSKNTKATAVSLNGPVKAIITDHGVVGKYGGFTAHCWLCVPAIESSVNPEYIHITSSRRESIKIGYFKERYDAHVNIHSKYGESKLLYL